MSPSFVATVRELWRYPVKSMAGESLTANVATSNGFEGDRAWACRDEVRGGIRGAKKFGGLLRLRATHLDPYGEGAPRITFLDGRSLMADDPAAAGAVSEAIGHPVTLWPLQPADQLEHYLRGQPDSDDAEAEARATFGLGPDDPFPDFSGIDKDLLVTLGQFQSPPGTYFDAYPIMLVSTQTLASLGRRSPGSKVDVRRFRPNLVVDAPSDEEFPEQGWVGRHVQIGDLTIRVATGCPRCVMISRPQGDLPEDRDLQRVVTRQLHHTVGVYATVVAGGAVRVGDPVSLTP